MEVAPEGPIARFQSGRSSGFQVLQAGAERRVKVVFGTWSCLEFSHRKGTHSVVGKYIEVTLDSVEC